MKLAFLNGKSGGAAFWRGLSTRRAQRTFLTLGILTCLLFGENFLSTKKTKVLCDDDDDDLPAHLSQ